MTDDLAAWAGPAWAELTDEQREQLAAAARDIAERYPDPDDQGERDAALSAAVQYLLGETTPEDAQRALVNARQREREAYVAAVHVAVMAHRLDGVPKATAARRAGIDRMTLLKALGER
ncbi:hypothetical protein [Micromonospora okii]|uniref:hypothetical protein n=1 Tax=Micromonospora okii TaxID=1182970 RepID=UPI001E3212F2|nr:hypothetical protein [Micromonospora okii]